MKTTCRFYLLFWPFFDKTILKICWHDVQIKKKWKIYFCSLFKQNVTFFSLRERELIAQFFYSVFLSWFYFLYILKKNKTIIIDVCWVHAVCKKNCLQLSSEAQMKSQSGSTQWHKCFQLMTLSVEHYSGKQPGSDPWPPSQTATCPSTLHTCPTHGTYLQADKKTHKQQRKKRL